MAQSVKGSKGGVKHKGGFKQRGRKTDEEEGERLARQEGLDRTFKPIFEEYEEQGGIPLRVLRQKLQEQGVTESIPSDKVEVLIRRADTDRDGHLDYNEFVNMMTSRERPKHMTRTQMTIYQRLIRVAVSSVVPNKSIDVIDGDVVENYIEHYNCRPPPIFMICISLIELIVFIVYAVELRGTKSQVTATSGVPLYSPFIYNPKRRYEAWRYLTYMLIHQGYMHLIFNLLFQLVLGIPLEMVHKWWRVGIVYSLGVIAGSMCHSVVDTDVYLAGASGGCYALIGAHFAIIIMNWNEMMHDWMEGPVRIISSAPVRLVFWTLLAGIDTGMAIYNRYVLGQNENIGYSAHFGGALAGLLIGIPVLKNLDVKPWEKIVWWVSLIAYIICVIFAILWNTFYPKFPPTDWRPCCPE